jgi:twitching motility protein PilT
MIMTIEPAIEYVHQPRQSFISQRSMESRTLREALDSAVHASFDVVDAGDLRDADGVTAAISAAEAGLLVLATMRSNSCVKALEQMVGFFDEKQQPWVRAVMANTLRAMITQVLVRKADGSGRCAVNEVLVVTAGIASVVREGYFSKLGTMIQAGGQDGMITLDDALMKKVEAKVVTPADAQLKAVDKARFQARIKPEAPAPPAPAAGTPEAPKAPTAPPPPAPAR